MVTLNWHYCGVMGRRFRSFFSAVFSGARQSTPSRARPQKFSARTAPDRHWPSRNLRVFYSAEAGHRYGYSLSEFVHPLQSAGDRRHVLVDRHRAGGVDSAFLFVVQLLSGAQFLVHHLHYLAIVVVEVVSYHGPVQQRSEDVDQLSTSSRGTVWPSAAYAERSIYSIVGQNALAPADCRISCLAFGKKQSMQTALNSF